MESPPNPSTVDTSRPFRSVKEAVAVFGERILAGELYSSSKQETSISYSPKSSSPPIQTTITTTHPNEEDSKNITTSSNSAILEALKKLEAELEETKVELKLLKEREQETEVALASLNAELHKNMSKLAGAEAAAAAAAAARPVGVEEGRRRELVIKRMEKKKTLAEILRIGEKQKCFGREMVLVKKKSKKEKPIVPLVGDLFFRKKGSPTSTLLYSAPEFYH